MWKAISAIAAALLMVGLFAILSGSSATNVVASTLPSTGKADRLAIAVEDCTQQAWPYLTAACLRGTSEQASGAKAIRIISADRTGVFSASVAPQRQQ